jgi:1-acyl-sn-glycerol-3-phosphate acyltransferase
MRLASMPGVFSRKSIAAEPARFIAKSELKRWPLIGRFAETGGTLFIDRSRRHDTRKVNRHAAEVLARGDVIAIFPEGTTTDGRDVLPFHGSLLQPIVDAEGHVQPVAIRYTHHEGGINDAVAYVGDTSFMSSFWRVTGERRGVVELHLPEPLPILLRPVTLQRSEHIILRCQGAGLIAIGDGDFLPDRIR